VPHSPPRPIDPWNGATPAAHPGAGDLEIDALRVSAYTVPTDYPESDGTLAWDSTTMVLVELRAGDHHGLGYTYANVAVAHVIEEHLRDLIVGHDPTAIPAAWLALTRKVRNLGQPGLSAMAIAAVDCALWDLKARTLGLPLATLLGAARDSVPIYGSGGFTSYPVPKLQEQLAGWAEQGLDAVKMKIGTDPEADPARVHAAREAIGPETALFVDANGAYTRKQALALAERFHGEDDVTWFEEPVSSDDLAGLRLLRDRGPAGMDIAAGEYGYTSHYFRQMLEAGAVDVLQADATRCGGITGFLQAGALAQSHNLQLSAHTAPALHLHPCIAVPELRNLEYFHDHVRIERIFFDGAPEPIAGTLRPDLSRPGLGLDFRRADAAAYAVYSSD
jgi:L-alanine-DL-glutamate epimerase-like enolase superfamily enzyme